MDTWEHAYVVMRQMIEKVKFYKVGENEQDARIKDSGCLRSKVRRKLKINYLPLSELTLSPQPLPNPQSLWINDNTFHTSSCPSVLLFFGWPKNHISLILRLSQTAFFCLIWSDCFQLSICKINFLHPSLWNTFLNIVPVAVVLNISELPSNLTFPNNHWYL